MSFASAILDGAEIEDEAGGEAGEVADYDDEDTFALTPFR